jgi:hypothetical protein
MIGSGITPCLRVRPRPLLERRRRSIRPYVSSLLTSLISHCAVGLDLVEGGLHSATHHLRVRSSQSAPTFGTRARIGLPYLRATGITAYLEAGGTLENAQAMAAHESPRTTKLYDRTGDEIILDEVERIAI